MRTLVRRLLRTIGLLSLSMIGMIVVAAAVAARHLLNTPQPLQSVLPGEDRLYRWKQGHIFYKVLGQEGAPPMLLLHSLGMGASAYEMRNIMEPLAQHYRVYAPDLLGFGLSDRPHIKYEAETYITLCRDFLTERVGQPAILLASGVSCNYAVAVAACTPELCERLILISPTALLATRQRAGGRATVLQAPLVKLLLFPVLGLRPQRRALHAGQRALSAHAAQSSSEVNHFYATTHQFGAEHAPMALLAGCLTPEVAAQFETLQQPTLILWGMSALQNARSLTQPLALSPQMQMELLQDADLYVHEDHPVKVLASIQAWLKEKVPQTRSVATSSEQPQTPEAPVEVPAAINSPGTSQEMPPVDVVQSATSGVRVEAYCVKCKAKREMQGAHEVTMKNGNPAVRGTCPVCSATLVRTGRMPSKAS